MSAIPVGQHQFHIERYNGDYTLAAVYSDGISLQYVRKINKVGMMVWTVPDGHPVLTDLDDDVFFRVRLSLKKLDPDSYYVINWYDDFTGIYKDKQVGTDENGNLYHILYIPHANEVLTRSIVGFYANTANLSTFSSADVGTIAELVVTENVVQPSLGSRIRAVDRVPSIKSATAITTGVTVDYSCAWRPVMDVMQELAELGAMDFDTDWDGIATTVRVSYYANQLGDDLSDDTFFATGMNNLGGVSQRSDKIQEKTVAIVAGRNQESDRDTSVRTGTNYSSTHSTEVFVDARDKASGELADLGDARLAQSENRTIIDGEVLQSKGWIYKRDYDIGDLVSVYFNGVEETRKVAEVEVTFAQQGDVKIRIGLEDE